MTTLIVGQHTTNPTQIETLVEFFHASDRGFDYVIPSAQVVSFIVDSDEFDDIGDEVFEELAEHYCQLNGLDYHRVFTSDAW